MTEPRIVIVQMVNALMRCRDMLAVFIDADPSEFPPSPEVPVMLNATKELHAQVSKAIEEGKKLYYEVHE